MLDFGGLVVATRTCLMQASFGSYNFIIPHLFFEFPIVQKIHNSQWPRFRRDWHQLFFSHGWQISIGTNVNILHFWHQ